MSKAGAAAVLAGVLLAAAPAGAGNSKKERLLAAKRAASAPRASVSWHRALDRRIGKSPKPIINIKNLWTQEVLVVDADPKSRGGSISQERVNRFFRCHFTNDPPDLDRRLFRVLLKAARRFKARRVHIISGFRSPKYNLMLRKKGRQVARNSQHTLGHAIDFRIPGVPTAKLRRWARSLKLGGVGYYPRSKFVHVDVGPVRYWSGR